MMARSPKAPIVPAHPLYLPESDEIAWDGRFPVQVVRFRHRRFDGSLSGTLTWELWRRGQAVVMMLYDPWTHRVAFVEQFRLPALAAGENPISRECPAGMLAPGEDPLECGIREAKEESGLTPDRTERIGEFMLSQGGTDELLHFYVGRVHLPEPGQGKTLGLEVENEETRVVVVDADEAFAMMGRNEIRNAVAGLCMLWLQLHSPRLRQEWITT
jgi:ADP-ribose pyrophosphatase